MMSDVQCWKQAQSTKTPPQKPQGPKDLLLKTPFQTLQGISDVLCSHPDWSELSQQYDRELLNIRQRVITLWLVGVSSQIVLQNLCRHLLPDSHSFLCHVHYLSWKEDWQLPTETKISASQSIRWLHLNLGDILYNTLLVIMTLMIQSNNAEKVLSCFQDIPRQDGELKIKGFETKAVLQYCN